MDNLFTYRYQSPLGGMTLIADGEALTGLYFDGQTLPGELPEPLPEAGALPVFAQTLRWLELYFSGWESDFTPALRPTGSPFQQEVWALLLEIPYGQTLSYGALAQRLTQRRGGNRSSARAVGGAVGRNPISLIIPCHRVIGADGSLTGYAGGLDRKRRLLELERG